jgi:hypothetical protein
MELLEQRALESGQSRSATNKQEKVPHIEPDPVDRRALTTGPFRPDHPRSAPTGNGLDLRDATPRFDAYKKFSQWLPLVGVIFALTSRGHENDKNREVVSMFAVCGCGRTILWPNL